MQLFRLFHNVAFYQKLNIVEQDNKNFNSGLPIICQLLTMVPDHFFKEAVEETESDRYYRKMKSKDHFISLFYAVLIWNGSLREVCKDIILLGKKLMYVGLKQIPCRSTLSDANKVKHLTDKKVYAENTARQYLNQLADMGIVKRREISGGHYYMNLELYRILGQ